MAEEFGGSAPERVPEDVPDGYVFQLQQDRLREFRQQSVSSVLDRGSALREDQRLEHSLYGHLKRHHWPDEIAIMVRLEMTDSGYLPVVPRSLYNKAAQLEFESESPNAVHTWVTGHQLDLLRLSEAAMLADSGIGAML